MDTNRAKLVREKMQKEQVDLLALAPGSHMRWLLGFSPLADERPCFLLISQESEIFITPALGAAEISESSTIRLSTWFDDHGPQSAVQSASAMLKASQVKTIALDESMRADFALLLLANFPEIKQTKFATDIIGTLRMIKTTAECAQLKEIAAINDQAMQAGFNALKAGLAEKDITFKINNAYQKAEAVLSFCLVAASENSAHPHHLGGNKIITANASVLIDTGAEKNGFFSDMTRVARLGHKISAEYKKIHQIVEEALSAGLASIKPGLMAKELDYAVRQVITKAGYGEYFNHRTGHGIGLDLHEPPYITARSTTLLQPGMVFTIEPGIYLPRKFGIRLEETVVMLEDGYKILSTLPREVFIA